MTSLHPVQVRYDRPARYAAVSELGDAVALLADPANQPARIVAGGSDLLLEIDRGVRRDVSLLIDISRCAEAQAITVAPAQEGQRATARLGPAVTHNAVMGNAALIAGALPLAQACWEVGSPQLRNRATVAGNIITASPANDTISPLVALGASVELTSLRGVRTLPVTMFITGFRTTALAADEVLTAITVPLLAADERGIYVKLGNRRAQAISVVHGAIVVGLDGDGGVRTATIALGSVAPTVVRLPDAAAALMGRRLDADVIEEAANLAARSVTPIGDVRATADYRRDTIVVLVRRALQALAADQQAARWPVAAPTLSRGVPVASPPAPGAVLTATDPITATVNGRERTAGGAVGATLLEWLRDELHCTGTKEGCAEGECGACTVRLDGAAVMSCLVPAGRANGAEIVTVEGLADQEELHPVQAAFVACGAVQCGFCTPGFIVAAESLLAECPQPSDDQIRHGLAGNLCRCTGYSAIVEAVGRAATGAS